MAKKDEQIFIGENDQVIELLGADKEAFLAQREADKIRIELLETEQAAKRQARIDAITKLGQASGLSAQEIEAILNI